MGLLLLLFFVALSSLLFNISGAAAIGLCYSRNGSGQLSAKDVVSLYKKLGFNSMRIYEPDPAALQALKSSGIEVIVGVPNNDLEQIATSMYTANRWVQSNILPYYRDVRFKYIAAGDDAIGDSNSQFVLGAMRNLYKALVAIGLEHKIMVSTAVSPISILGPWALPSMGAFSNTTKAQMKSISTFLAFRDSPLLANVHPYYSYVNNRIGIPLSYALGTSNSYVFVDGQRGYTRLFDAMVDALYAALERVGAPDVVVVVSETGWPWKGRSSVATVGKAKAYMWNIVRHVRSGRGTPRRKGGIIQTFIFSGFDDKGKYGRDNFALFYGNKNPVYTLPSL